MARQCIQNNYENAYTKEKMIYTKEGMVEDALKISM
jgi:hypothetical protein